MCVYSDINLHVCLNTEKGGQGWQQAFSRFGYHVNKFILFRCWKLPFSTWEIFTGQ